MPRARGLTKPTRFKSTKQERTKIVRGLNSEPNLPWVRMTLSNTLVHSNSNRTHKEAENQAEENEKKGKLHVVVEDYKATLALDPNHVAHNVQLHFSLCKLLVKFGRGKDALNSCTTRTWEIHFFSFNHVDKRTALTYIDDSGNWHRTGKGAPEEGMRIIKDTYEDNNVARIVMELCKGGKLFNWMVARGHYAERAAVVILRTRVEVVQLSQGIQESIHWCMIFANDIVLVINLAKGLNNRLKDEITHYEKVDICIGVQILQPNESFRYLGLLCDKKVPFKLNGKFIGLKLGQLSSWGESAGRSQKLEQIGWKW
ncbi:hypothetical protein Tco_0922593 [Tanacetum coccineum]|uniref:Uncharacterized protein n=1 Tax=Tanacetum coccineum TaxID=301880 RepID=A0ABQ5D514_9ASTR